VTDIEDIVLRDPSKDPTALVPSAFGEDILTTRSASLPLTKEALDLMDTPVPSGVLAEEFAYHGLAPSFLKEMTKARDLLDEILTELKRLSRTHLSS
jgi:hypothetical protein